MHCNHSKSFHHNLISIQHRLQPPAVLACCSPARSTHPAHRWGLWRTWGDTGRWGHCPGLQYNIHHGHTQYHGRWRPAHHLPTEGAFSRAWSVILCTFNEDILMKILFFSTVCQVVVSPQRFLHEILLSVVRNPQHACFYINLFIISQSLNIIKMCKEKISENYWTE